MKPKPTISAIQSFVAARYGLSHLQLVQRGPGARQAQYAWPRMVSMWLCRRLEVGTHAQVAAAHRRCRESCRYAVKACDNLTQSSPLVADELAGILAACLHYTVWN